MKKLLNSRAAVHFSHLPLIQAEDEYDFNYGNDCKCNFNFQSVLSGQKINAFFIIIDAKIACKSASGQRNQVYAI